MEDWEDKIVYVAMAILLVMLISAGGWGILMHPYMLVSFIFVFGGAIFFILIKIFPYGTSRAKNYKPEEKIEDI